MRTFSSPHHILANCTMQLRLRSPLHRTATYVFPATTHRAGISPPLLSLLRFHHSFTTQSLTECAPFLRTYRIPPLRSGNALTQALPCNPCPPPPRFHSLPIYFFSKFSFPCGSIRSLKSAFIIVELSVLEELYRKVSYPEFFNRAL